MALAVHLKFVLFVLCNSVFDNNLAGGATIVGSNVSIAAQRCTRERFYLNTARPAPTNGTITCLRYCYYGSLREDNNRNNTYRALMALYRPVPGSSNYQRIKDTVTVNKRTPLSQVPPADVLLLGFNCDSVELEESVRILQGDVIGACIYDTIRIRQLDVVSRSDNGYPMLFNSADDEDCENGVLPEVVGSNLKQTRILRILHIFAEILPADVNVEIGNDSATTVMVPSTLQDQSTSEVIIIEVIVGGLATAAIATMIMTIIIVAASCFLMMRRKRRNNNYSGYSNLTYNVRRGQVESEDENESDSSSQQHSTVPYYDYVEDGTPQPPRSRGFEGIIRSSGSSDSMEPNMSYSDNIMIHQVAGLRVVDDSSHSMVQNQAYRLHQITDSYNASNLSYSMVQNQAYKSHENLIIDSQ